MPAQTLSLIHISHLQDATPIKFSQEISGWRSSLERDEQLLGLAAVSYTHLVQAFFEKT